MSGLTFDVMLWTTKSRHALKKHTEFYRRRLSCRSQRHAVTPLFRSNPHTTLMRLLSSATRAAAASYRSATPERTKPKAKQLAEALASSTPLPPPLPSTTLQLLPRGKR